MRATVLLVAVNVAVFVAMLVACGMGGITPGFSGSDLLRFGAVQGDRVLHDGEAWRLVTATMVHLHGIHLLMNMVALVQVGRALEPRFGAARVLAVYLVTGVAGALGSAVWFAGTGAVSAGASGAICGLIGATAVVGHLVGGPAGLRLRNAMATWGVIVVVSGAAMGADSAAHVGGLVAGALLGLAVEKIGIQRRGGALVDALAMLAFLVVGGACFAAVLLYHQPFSTF